MTKQMEKEIREILNKLWVGIYGEKDTAKMNDMRSFPFIEAQTELQTLFTTEKKRLLQEME